MNAEAFEALFGSNREAPTPPLSEALIETLKEVADRYLKPCPFKIGALVTPRAGYSIVNDGQPCVVVDVSHTTGFYFDGNPSSHSYGARLDVRVVHWQEGCIVMHWVESWQFELYTP